MSRDRKGEAGKHGNAVFLRLSLIKRVWGGRGEFEGGRRPFWRQQRASFPPQQNTFLLRAVIGVEADVFVAEVGGAQIVAAVAQAHMDLHRDVGGFEQL